MNDTALKFSHHSLNRNNTYFFWNLIGNARVLRSHESDKLTIYFVNERDLICKN